MAFLNTGDNISLFGPDFSDKSLSSQSQSTSISKKPSVMNSTNVVCFIYNSKVRKYEPQGRLGIALIGNSSNNVYQIIIYKDRKTYISVTTLSSIFQFQIRNKRYGMFYDDKGKYWSVLYPSEDVLYRFTISICIGKYSLSDQSRISKMELVGGNEKDIVKKGSLIGVVYSGWFIIEDDGIMKMGKMFDSNVSSGGMVKFRIGDEKVIKGWEMGLIGAKGVGSKIFIIIPPHLAYGMAGNEKGQIPPNATLSFQIEIIKAKPPKMTQDFSLDTPQFQQSLPLQQQSLGVLNEPGNPLPDIISSTAPSEIISMKEELKSLKEKLTNPDGKKKKSKKKKKRSKVSSSSSSEEEESEESDDEEKKSKEGKVKKDKSDDETTSSSSSDDEEERKRKKRKKKRKKKLKKKEEKDKRKEENDYESLGDILGKKKAIFQMSDNKVIFEKLKEISEQITSLNFSSLCKKDTAKTSVMSGPVLIRNVQFVLEENEKLKKDLSDEREKIDKLIEKMQQLQERNEKFFKYSSQTSDDLFQKEIDKFKLKVEEYKKLLLEAQEETIKVREESKAFLEEKTEMLNKIEGLEKLKDENIKNIEEKGKEINELNEKYGVLKEKSENELKEQKDRVESLENDVKRAGGILEEMKKNQDSTSKAKKDLEKKYKLLEKQSKKKIKDFKKKISEMTKTQEKRDKKIKETFVQKVNQIQSDNKEETVTVIKTLMSTLFKTMLMRLKNESKVMYKGEKVFKVFKQNISDLTKQAIIHIQNDKDIDEFEISNEYEYVSGDEQTEIVVVKQKEVVKVSDEKEEVKKSPKKEEEVVEVKTNEIEKIEIKEESSKNEETGEGMIEDPLGIISVNTVEKEDTKKEVEEEVLGKVEDKKEDVVKETNIIEKEKQDITVVEDVIIKDKIFEDKKEEDVAIEEKSEEQKDDEIIGDVSDIMFEEKKPKYKPDEDIIDDIFGEDDDDNTEVATKKSTEKNVIVEEEEEDIFGDMNKITTTEKQPETLSDPLFVMEPSDIFTDEPPIETNKEEIKVEEIKVEDKVEEIKKVEKVEEKKEEEKNEEEKKEEEKVEISGATMVEDKKDDGGKFGFVENFDEKESSLFGNIDEPAIKTEKDENPSSDRPQMTEEEKLKKSSAAKQLFSGGGDDFFAM